MVNYLVKNDHLGSTNVRRINQSITFVQYLRNKLIDIQYVEQGEKSSSPPMKAVTVSELATNRQHATLPVPQSECDLAPVI
jgi:hypothetical protein